MTTNIASTSSSSDDDDTTDSLCETDLTVLKCSKKWQIKNFSNCWMKPGKKLYSPTFYSETDNRIKWCLSLYPTGINDDHKDNLSLYLTLVTSFKAEIIVKYKFSILNGKGEASNLYENAEGATLSQNWDEHKPSSGADEFVSRSFLMETANGLLPNDKLTICCEVSASMIIPSSTTSDSDNILHADRWDYTHVKVVELTYLWTISNFTLCKEKVGEYIVSPLFSALTDNNLQWKLKLFPNGQGEGDKETLSIFLYPATIPKTALTASYQLTIVPARSKKINISYPLTYTWAKGETWGHGYPRWREKNYLLKRRDIFLPDDKLTIHCAIRYVTENVNISKEAQPIMLQTANPRRLNDDLGVLLENEKFSNVTLVVDGKEFRAHKTILSARSPVFSAMFQYKSQEHSEEKIEITDLNYEVLKETLRFIYTGTTKKLATMASALLAAADFYILEDLKFTCEEELSSKIGIENAADILILADKYNAKQLKTHVVDFVNAHAMLVMDTQSFKNMAASCPQLIADIGVKRLLDVKKN